MFITDLFKFKITSGWFFFVFFVTLTDNTWLLNSFSLSCLYELNYHQNVESKALGLNL